MASDSVRARYLVMDHGELADWALTMEEMWKDCMAERDELKKAHRWIPVEEELPADDEVVVALSYSKKLGDYLCTLRHLCGEVWREDSDDTVSFEQNVTYWHRLPPEVEQEI